MGIKWADVKVLNSPLTGKICIGKLDRSGMIATDRSEDMTQVIISAVMVHMDFNLKPGDKGTVSTSEAGALYWIPNGFKVTVTKEELPAVDEAREVDFAKAYALLGKPTGFGDCRDGVHHNNNNLGGEQDE